MAPSFALFAAPVNCDGVVVVVVPTILELVAVTVLVPVALPPAPADSELECWLLSAELLPLVTVVDAMTVVVAAVVVSTEE